MKREDAINEVLGEACGDMIVEMANVRSDRGRNVSVQVNRGETHNCDYFKFYNHQDYKRADKVCRISMFEARYTRTHSNKDGKRNWVLNSSERKMLVECLNERDGDAPFTVWEMLIIAFNNENPTQSLDMFGTMRNKMNNLIYPDHLPIDLPMPDYRSLR